MVSERKILPSYEYLHNCFLYCADTGKLHWKERPTSHFLNAKAALMWNAKWAGREAGSLNDGYYRVRIFGSRFFVHQVVWTMWYGVWPVKQLDHIDTCRINNRIGNFREATNSENKANSKRSSNNTSGVKGVHWSTRAKKWQAGIKVDGKTRYLGTYSTLSEARRAYEAAAVESFGKFARSE